MKIKFLILIVIISALYTNTKVQALGLPTTNQAPVLYICDTNIESIASNCNGLSPQRLIQIAKLNLSEPSNPECDANPNDPTCGFNTISKNSEDFILSKLGREIYENFYKNYTIKQWGIHPKNLDKSIVGRLPIRLNRNPFYVNQKLRVMPKKGYTALFNKMLSDKNIKVLLKTDYRKIKNKFRPRIATVYTGPPDTFFNNKYGKLDWRSLNFKFKTFKKKKIQNCVQINFPNDHKYTRKVEIKHVTKQKSAFTSVCKEYPTEKGDPYYPINNKKNKKRFNNYKKLISLYEKKDIYFEGRLAQYKYLNMDEVIERALNLFKKINKKYSNKK